MDVHTSRFEPLSYVLGPPGRRRFVSYKGIQGGFRELWKFGVGSAEEPELL
jgi:hypothetical protein